MRGTETALERSSPASAYRAFPRFAKGFATVIVLLNLLVVAIGWADRSWTAVGLALFWGPALNLALGSLSCLLIPALKRRDPNYPVRWHVRLAFALPVVGAVLAALAIRSMDLHGC